MKGDSGCMSVEMEDNLVEQGSHRVVHVNKVGHAKRVIAKKRKPYHRRVKKHVPKVPKVKKDVPKVPKVLQELFVSCKDIFKGPGTVPSSRDVQRLCHILDKMKLEDVGLSKDLPFFNPENSLEDNLRVTQTTIYKCDNFSLCMFFLPAKGVIPLHNHPGMTVFSKLLGGKMHIKSYDWADPDEASHNLVQQPSSQLRLAKLKADSVFTAPCDTSVLYPRTGGNIHEFTALTPCAVLDVLGPPYSKDDGRDCSYYKDHPYTAFPNGEAAEVKEKSNSYGWLEEIEMPENSRMAGMEYWGPQITETAL